MLKFKSLGTFEITGRGTVFLVENDVERPRDESGLLGSPVNIDGVEYIIRGIESYGTPKILKGQQIGLLVKKI